MIHTHVHTGFFYIHSMLCEAGKQNDVLLLEREQVQPCFKVKGSDQSTDGKVFFGVIHVCYRICCNVMVEYRVQSLFGIIICINSIWY